MRRPFDALKAFVEKQRERRVAKKGLHEAEKLLAENEDRLAESSKTLAATEGIINTTSNEIKALTAQLEELKQKLDAVQRRQEEFHRQRTREQADVEEGKAQVDVARDKLANAKANYDKTVREERSTLSQDHPGPEKKMMPIEVVATDASEATTVHALGDLHGWAPGLINYLTTHGLAKIEISGIKVYNTTSSGAMSVDHDAMGLLFPDLKEYLTTHEGMDTEQQILEWPHAGLLGQPGKVVNADSHHTAISAEWTGKNEMFIQVGDVFDRADHSELAAEILRQLVIQAPAHVHILVGNHEEFLLLNNKESWVMNEEKWIYEAGKGGNTRLLSMLYDDAPEEELLDLTWDRYKSSAATLYLTQFFAKEGLDTSGPNPLGFLEPKELQRFKERILSGTWEGYSAARELHERILESTTGSSITYPGAIAGLGVGDTWFMHAEPNGLKAFIEHADASALVALQSPRTIGGRDFLVLEMDLAYDAGTNRYRSNCTELFWARDASTGFEGLNSRFSSQTAPVLGILPGVRNIVHGHSPISIKLDENSPHTYIARTLTKPVSPTTGSIRVYNIDEGMTPVYGDFTSNRQKMEYTPVGLRVPNQILDYHRSGDLIDDEDLWTLNEAFLEANHPAFTVTKALTLTEVPEQYRVKGPGQVVLRELTQANSGVEHTSSDNFRRDPTQFSWLKMNHPENITNPLEGSSPPPDGRYRVQHGTKTMTLSEHLLMMLELEAEPPLGKLPFDSHTTKTYLEGLRTPFNAPKEDFTTWGAVWDAYQTEAVFLNLRCTENGACLNVRGMNMAEQPVTIRLLNHLDESGSPTPSTSTAETQILLEPGSRCIRTFKLIQPESFVDVEIDLGEGTQTMAIDMVFGASASEAAGDPEATTIRLLTALYDDYSNRDEYNEQELPGRLLHTERMKRAQVKQLMEQRSKQGPTVDFGAPTVREKVTGRGDESKKDTAPPSDQNQSAHDLPSPLNGQQNNASLLSNQPGADGTNTLEVDPSPADTLVSPIEKAPANNPQSPLVARQGAGETNQTTEDMRGKATETPTERLQDGDGTDLTRDEAPAEDADSPTEPPQGAKETDLTTDEGSADNPDAPTVPRKGGDESNHQKQPPLEEYRPKIQERNQDMRQMYNRIPIKSDKNAKTKDGDSES